MTLQCAWCHVVGSLNTHVVFLWNNLICIYILLLHSQKVVLLFLFATRCDLY
jgi:hypothetical protein